MSYQGLERSSGAEAPIALQYIESVNREPGSNLFSLVPSPEHRELLDENNIQDPPFIKAFKKLCSSGWQTACFIFGLVTVTAFFINMSFTIWALVKTEVDHNDNVRIIKKGECNRMLKLNTVVHIFINALSTVLLAASNYTMQCLTCPTRTDVNNAHRSKKWLDIGVQSIRNLRRLGGMRLAIWCLLFLSSLPLHFIYNSVVVFTLATYEVSVYMMSNSITQHNTTDFDNLNITGLLAAYSAFSTDRYDLVLVFSGNLPEYLQSRYESSSVQPVQYSNGIAGPFNYTDYDIICDGNYPCDPTTHGFSWKINGSHVDHCLSKRVPEQCSLQLSSHLMLIVVFANAIKSFCILWVALWGRNRGEPLVTIGDAIFSFLDEPDETTANSRIVTKDDIKGGFWDTSAETQTHWRPHKVRWYQSASPYRWTSCYLLFITTLGATTGVFIHGYKWEGLKTVGGLSTLWTSGVQAEQERAMKNSTLPYQFSLVSYIVIANSPQLVMSLLYFLYNSLFTSMLLGKEWDSLSRKWRPLRVTCPRQERREAGDGAPTDRQRATWIQTYLRPALSSCTKFFQKLRPARPTDAQGSSYFLQLPYRYSIPLLLMSSLVHWLVSQSLYVMRIEFIDGSQWLGQAVPTTASIAYNEVEWSPIAIIVTIIVSTIVPIVAIMTGLRKYDGNIPLVGSCSAAISAACHPGYRQTAVGVRWCKWEGADGVERWSLKDSKE